MLLWMKTEKYWMLLLMKIIKRILTLSFVEIKTHNVTIKIVMHHLQAFCVVQNVDIIYCSE